MVADINFLTNRLQEHPFNLHLSEIQLSNDLDQRDLYQLMCKVLNHIKGGASDFQNQTPSGIVYFLQILQYETREGELEQKLINGDRETILDILEYLLKNESNHKTVAYLATFLTPVPVPEEYLQDDRISELLDQYQRLQSEFKLVHKNFDNLTQKNSAIVDVKRDIKTLEEEKAQLISQISRKQKQAEVLPNFDHWLENARGLRIEQNYAADTQSKQAALKTEISSIEEKIELKKQEQTKLKNSWAAGPEAVIRKLDEDNKISQLLADNQLPNSINEKKAETKLMLDILARGAVGPKDFGLVEENIKQCTEQLRKSSHTNLDANDLNEESFNLLKQQASAMQRKKTALADKLASVMENKAHLESKLSKGQISLSVQNDGKFPRKDALKQYLLDIRNNASAFKEKKMELAALASENNILGFTSKFLIDYFGSNRSTDTNNLEQELAAHMSYINSQKNTLAPKVQELQNARERLRDMEYFYQEKKKLYDAAMMTIETENIQLNNELKVIRNEIEELDCLAQFARLRVFLVEIDQEKVLNEMKAYVGGDAGLEVIQKRRGFSNYRDLFIKKIHEVEIHSKQLKERLKDLQETLEPNMKQQQILKQFISILQFKAEFLVQSNEKRSTINEQKSTPDRLVL